LEAGFDGVGSHLRESLGNRVGIHFASVIRKSIVERDRDTLKQLLARTDQLETLRKNLQERVGTLELLGGDGKKLGSSLVSAWEDWAIDPTEATNGRLTAEIKRNVAFSQEMERRAQRSARRGRNGRHFVPRRGYSARGGYCRGLLSWRMEHCREAVIRPDTSYNWTLNGGRIRVGRIEGRAFVLFIRDERDQAVNSSF
jgi:hypothetical protein